MHAVIFFSRPATRNRLGLVCAALGALRLQRRWVSPDASPNGIRTLNGLRAVDYSTSRQLLSLHAPEDKRRTADVPHGEKGLEVLLVHPGGPYFQNKDQAAWTIPKGEVTEGEDLLGRARIEFEEELGIPATGNCMELGSAKQKGGKTVHAWAFAGDLEDDFKIASNTFEMEWPPRSGKVQRFPEVDRASFFSLEEARRKINVAQTVFLDRLIEQLNARRSGEV